MKPARDSTGKYGSVRSVVRTARRFGARTSTEWRTGPENRGAVRRGLTLLEVVLVVGIMAILAALAVPAFLRDIEKERLPQSAEKLRALITLTRANAAFDSKRYRIRFPDEDEVEKLRLLDDRQPVVEVEDDPINEPEVFQVVRAPWAMDETLHKGVRCARVRLGRPSATRLKDEREEVVDKRELLERFKDFDPERPPLVIEADGTSEWATFVLTTAAADVDFRRLEAEKDAQVEVILDGVMGLIWLQRTFYDDELDLFEDKNWPVVLRQDYLDPRAITEQDVLELHELWTGGESVQIGRSRR